MRIEDIEIATQDGKVLAGTLFCPLAVSNCGAVVISSATAVPRRYYCEFASFLAETGFHVITFDYRGIGDSRPRSLRGFRAKASDWGRYDLDGALSWVLHYLPHLRLCAVGHSIGAVLLGIAPTSVHIRRAVMVAPQSGYWKLFPTPQKEGWAVTWHLLVPLLTRIFGYFPARSMGFGEDLPAGVASEFARWCKNPDYLVSREWNISRAEFRRLSAEILLYSIDDDLAAPARALRPILELFDPALIQRHHLIPSELGVQSFGHFGFFRREHRHSIWTGVGRWLNLEDNPYKELS